jgi:arginase
LSDLALISAPFHLGLRGLGMGNGPIELIEGQGLPGLLDAGHDVELWEAAEPAATHEPGRVFELARSLSTLVSRARAEGRLPVILAGDCSASIGAIAGINLARVGVVWLDAHPDFHTPETTETGYLDGMSLATVTGSCWQAMANSVPGFRAVSERNTVLVGARDIDPGECDRLEAAQLTVLRGEGADTLDVSRLDSALSEIGARAEGAYLHIDFDSIDPSFGKANEFAVDGGLSPDDVAAVVSAVASRLPIAAISLTAYNPEIDDRFAETAMRVALSACGAR